MRGAPAASGCATGKSSLLFGIKCWSEVLYLHLPPGRVFAPIKIMCGDRSDQSFAEAQRQVERLRIGVDIDVRPKVSLDQPGLPSVQELNAEKKANAECVATGRVLGRPLCGLPAIYYRSLTGYISKACRNFFTHWKMWMDADREALYRMCQTGYTPWILLGEAQPSHHRLHCQEWTVTE